MPQTEGRQILPIAQAMKLRKNIREIISSFSLSRAVTELAQFWIFHIYHDWHRVDCNTMKFNGEIVLMENIQVQQVLFCILVLLLINTLLCLEHCTLLLVLALAQPLALFFLSSVGNSTHLCRAWHRNVILCLKSVNKYMLVWRNSSYFYKPTTLLFPFPHSLDNCRRWFWHCASVLIGSVAVPWGWLCFFLLRLGVLPFYKMDFCLGWARVCPPSRLGFNWPGLGSLVPPQIAKDSVSP